MEDTRTQREMEMEDTSPWQLDFHYNFFPHLASTLPSFSQISPLTRNRLFSTHIHEREVSSYFLMMTVNSLLLGELYISRNVFFRKENGYSTGLNRTNKTKSAIMTMTMFIGAGGFLPSYGGFVLYLIRFCTSIF